MANCNICGQQALGPSNGHDQPPPPQLGGQPECPVILTNGKQCESKIRRWCPATGKKLCYLGHRS